MTDSSTTPDRSAIVELPAGKGLQAVAGVAAATIPAIEEIQKRLEVEVAQTTVAGDAGLRGGAEQLAAGDERLA